MSKLTGPNLILAGPGTGKTTFLINKTVELFRSVKDKKDGILISTFTRKATDELITRLYSKLSLSEINKVNFIVGTIHSICFELLSRYSDKDFGDYQVLPEESQVHFIHSKLKNLGFSNDRIKKNGWLLAEELASIYNKINDDQVDYAKLDFKNDIELEEACYTYSTYKKLLTKNRLFDFASIQSTFLNELAESPDFVEKIKSDYNYFLVDEFQDVNNIQNQIFLKLSEPNYNLTIVGDDDQSIYAFRGSSVEHIRNFEKLFLAKGINVANHILNINYRSTENVVSYTNSLLQNSTYQRIEKGITPHRVGDSHPVIIKEFETEEEESQYISESIIVLKEKGIITSYGQIAILFRSLKGHSEQVINSLKNNHIPFTLIGAGNFFDSIIGLEFIALLEYYLAKDIDKTQLFFHQLVEIDINHNTDLTSIYSSRDFLENLEAIFNNKDYKSCIDLCYDLFIGTKFLIRNESEGPNIGKLTDIVLKFDDFSERFDPWGLFSYLNYLRNNQEVDYEQPENNDSIRLITIHQSKGLEFPVVFMPSQIERNKRSNIVDRLNALISEKKQGIDEDERVIYVGCTRAEDLLIITGSKSLSKTKKVYQLNKIIKAASKNLSCSDALNYKILEKQKFRNAGTGGHKSIILSYNKISLYNFCPRAYMYSNVWNLQTVRIGGLEYGRNIHKVIEILIREIISKVPISSINIDNLIEDNWKNADFRKEEENEKFKIAAKSQISTFILRCKDYLVPERIFSVEDQFNISVDETLITGRFDAVFEDDNQHIIIDFKTGDIRNYSSQLSFYKLCFGQKYNPSKKINLAIYYLKEGKLEYITPIDEHEELKKIDYVSKSIQNGNFKPTPGKVCKDCAFNNVCEFSV